MLPSLLDFKPEQYGLPGFEDMISGVVPVEPVWKLKGKVVKGFGRGSKELGIPTANLDAGSLQVSSHNGHVCTLDSLHSGFRVLPTVAFPLLMLWLQTVANAAESTWVRRAQTDCG